MKKKQQRWKTLIKRWTEVCLFCQQSKTVANMHTRANSAIHYPKRIIHFWRLMLIKGPAGSDGQLSASCTKALVALSISLSCWFKICMRQHLFPINWERQRGNDGDKTKRGRAQKENQIKIGEVNMVQRDREWEEETKKRQKTFLWINWRAR